MLLDRFLTRKAFALSLSFLLSVIPAFAARKIIEVPPDAQREVQTFFDGIYRKIRLPTDPATPPRIVLMKSDSAAASVNPGDKTRVYWDVDYVLGAENEDVLAGTYAHELTHFEEGQERRREKSYGTATTIANELEAQSIGIVRRLCRLDEKGPDGNPAAAVYSLEAVIEDYERDSRYFNKYANFQNVASALKVFYAVDRYKRRYPSTLSRPPSLPRLRTIGKGGWDVGYVKTDEETPSPVRQEVMEAFGLYGKHPTEQLSLLVDRLGGSAAQNTDDTLAVLRQLDLILSQMNSLSPTSLSDSDSERYRSFFRKLPTDYFQTLRRRVSHEHYMKLDHSYLFAQYADTEEMFQKLREDKPIPKRYLHIPNRYQFHSLFFSEKIRAESYYIEKRESRSPAEVVSFYAYILEAEEDFPKGTSLNNRARAFFETITPELFQKALKEQVLPDWVAINSLRPFSIQKKLTLSSVLNITVKLQIATDELEYAKQEIDSLVERGFLPHALVLIEQERKLGRLPISTLDTWGERAVRKRIQICSENPIVKSEVDARAILHGAIASFQGERGIPPPVLALLRTLAAGPLHDVDVPAIVHGLKNYGRGSSLTTDIRDVSTTLAHTTLETTAWGTILNTGEQDREDILRRQLPKTRQALIDFVASKPLFFLTEIFHNAIFDSQDYLGFFPWEEIVSRMTPREFLTIATLQHKLSSHSELRGETPDARVLQRNQALINDVLSKKFVTLLEQNRLTDEQGAAALGALTHFDGGGATTNSDRILTKVQSILLNSYTWDKALAYLGAVSPQSFPTPQAYSDYVSRLISPHLVSLHAHKPGSEAHTSALLDVSQDVQKALGHIDPLLRQLVLDEMAPMVQAVPHQRSILTVSATPYEDTTIKGIEYANAVLEGYSKLKPHEKWEFLQWVRGRNPHLKQNVLDVVNLALARHGIYLPLASLEVYLRQRFDALTPTGRAVFFQICLEGNEGLLTGRRSYAGKIRDEVLADLSRPVRRTIDQIHQAALHALPKSYRNVILSSAFAESGKGGSPEEALRLILSRMGALVQKFGQNLAFDSHLPESYREELKKLWDEGTAPGWWKTYELLQHQWGDIAEAGFRLVKIRNAGTTEVTVELEGPDGRRHITSVQHESLKHSAEVDAQDLRKFVAYLKGLWGGKRRYGFLSLLVEDAVRTMETEADRMHKPTVTPLMRRAYEKAAMKLGATVAAGHTVLKGWKIEGSLYETFPLPGGKSLVAQRVAPGVPFKSIQKTNPQLYSELSHLIIDLEHEVQKQPDAPIDKDRMPGQVLVDEATRTITLLDHGQAKHVNPRMHAHRDPFIAAALAANVGELEQIIRDLGKGLTAWQRASLLSTLGWAEAAYRPFEALNWIRDQKLISAERTEDFWDLVHLVRAQARLAHWGESVGVSLVQDQWREQASKSAPADKSFVGICLHLFSSVRGRSN